MVLIGFFKNVFYPEYNSTMPSQLAEKSLPPTRPPFHLPIIHNAAITRKLSTVLVADNMRFVRNMGVLLDRDRVAFPEKHWKNNADMSVYVYCWDQTAKKLYTKNYNLHERIPEDERFYEAQGIVEVKVSSIAKEFLCSFYCGPFKVVWLLDWLR